MRKGGILSFDTSSGGAAATIVQSRRVEQTRRDAWERMAILSRDVTLPEYQADSVGLSKALTVVGDCFPESNSLRSVASAGAIYPFELYVFVKENEGLALFRLDPARRLCKRVETGTEEVRSTGLPVFDTNDALVFVVSRPWFSMRKYGDRGYLYTQLDVAHLAENLAGIAQNLGFSSVLRLRFARGPVTDLLDIGSRCREIHSVLQLSGGPVAEPVPHWRIQDGRGTEPGASDDPWWLETACWTSLSPLLDVAELTENGVAEVRSQALVSLRPGLGFATPFPSGASRSELSRKRTSSKGFGSAGLPRSRLWQAVAACQEPVTTDVAAGEVGLALVVRDVPGQPPGVYRLTEDGGDVPGVVLDGEQVVRACMNQGHLRNAAAIVVLYAPHGALLNRGQEQVRDTLFCAGALGQLLYLGATEAGIGVTGVGGFDAERWRQLAHLPSDREPLYLVAFGTDVRQGVKWDRLPTAYAQNES